MTARIALAATLFALVLAPATRADDVLIDQLAPAGSGSSTASLNAAGYQGETADDFTVPAGTQWTIGTVTATGLAYGGNASEPVRVRIYPDAGGLPGATPAVDQTVTASSTTGTIAAVLTAAPALAPGVYWLSVQTQGPLLADEWFWGFRAAQSGSPAAYRTPTGPCSAWTQRSTCAGGAAAPDQLYKLTGTSGPATAASGGGTTPATPSSPAGGTGTPPAPATQPGPPPAISTLVDLPAAKRCRSRRTLTLHVALPANGTITSLTVRLGGRKLRTVTGAGATATVKLAGLPKGTYTVELRAVTPSGKRPVLRRTYRTCAAKRR